ncbi:hypothetical protein GCM10007877_26730 [Marinibactrum halimedae]|uniref:Glycosyltransferase family 4 protein n=1 Tax=Marinibactrum halimedae TaxID=1444977 RepID=A0AA37T530_9GAMM|nr:hypothetical protein GCM10007877_26730 [Marinibactrum halimedae]
MVVLGLIWLTNLYNFMDGIDGIAAGEAISVLLGAGLILFLKGETNTALLTWLAIFPVAGFLYWNWPPAKLFMGDSCSTFLGLTFGILALITATQGKMSIWTWVILLGAFIVDATWTLVTRIVTGQDWRAPHRSHVYQKLSPSKAQHKKTSILYASTTTLWLLPIGFYVEMTESTPFFYLLTFIPLTIVAYKLRAGQNAQ